MLIDACTCYDESTTNSNVIDIPILEGPDSQVLKTSRLRGMYAHLTVEGNVVLCDNSNRVVRDLALQRVCWITSSWRYDKLVILHSNGELCVLRYPCDGELELVRSYVWPEAVIPYNDGFYFTQNGSVFLVHLSCEPELTYVSPEWLPNLLS